MVFQKLIQLYHAPSYLFLAHRHIAHTPTKDISQIWQIGTTAQSHEYPLLTIIFKYLYKVHKFINLAKCLQFIHNNIMVALSMSMYARLARQVLHKETGSNIIYQPGIKVVIKKLGGGHTYTHKPASRKKVISRNQACTR